jgi:hypothetical protein
MSTRRKKAMAEMQDEYMDAHGDMAESLNTEPR